MRKSLRGLLGLIFLALFPARYAAAYITNKNVYVPPNYNTFVPPAAGGSYVDPVFGTAITRISDAAHTTRADTGGSLPWIEAEYSTKSPFNEDNSKILLLEFSYFALYDGVTLKRIKPLCCVSGAIVAASSEPLWSRTDPNILYFHPAGTNLLKTYNVATDAVTTIHTFSEYTSISAGGESEMSYDGNHIVLAGEVQGNTNYTQVFVYTINTDSKGPVYDTTGHNWDALYISPDNNVLIAWKTNGTARYQGEELYDINMNFLRQAANNDGHKHMTRDVDGSEVLVQTNSADPTPIPNCQNGFVKIKLANAQQTCLLQLDWSLSVHVTSADQDGWVFAETYNSSASSSPWYAYTNELLQIKLDGTEVRRLAHHRSDTTTYDGQPRISASRDGSRFTFNSNMMGSTTDVYLVTGSAGLVSIAPSTAVVGGSAFTLTVNGTNFWTGSLVQWNGVTVPTTFLSNTQLTASIPASDLASPGVAQVTILHPVAGGNGPATGNFSITQSIFGVVGQAPAFGVSGVASGTTGIGVLGQATATTGTTFGISGLVQSSTGIAGEFETPSGGNLLIGAVNGTNKFRVDGGGNVYETSNTTGGADFAESLGVVGAKTRYEPGDVLVIDPAGIRRMALASEPYSRLAAGIYSTRPGVLASPYVAGDPRLAGNIPLAVAGIVPCKVSAENGPIEAGDLLVTSSSRGYAMKGTDPSKMLGAVIGKALEPFQRGKGVIEVLVTLQ